MKKIITYHSIIISIVIGIVLGLLAKLVDVPKILGILPIFDAIGGRFAIWIFTATLLAVFSHSPIEAAIKVFSFFVSMLFTYYTYTILFLGFFPKSQIILWGSVSFVSPFCGFVIWYSRQNTKISNFLAALPIIAFFTEWYITGDGDKLLFGIYFCMAACLLICIPKQKRRCLPIILISVVITVLLVKAELLHSVYQNLLNI